MQDIGVIYQIFAKFHGFIVKYRFQNNFFQKKGGKFKFFKAKNRRFLNGSHGSRTSSDTLLKKVLGSSNTKFFGPLGP